MIAIDYTLLVEPWDWYRRNIEAPGGEPTGGPFRADMPPLPQAGEDEPASPPAPIFQQLGITEHHERIALLVTHLTTGYPAFEELFPGYSRRVSNVVPIRRTGGDAA